MSLNMILIIYAFLFILACFAFIEQRAELEIGREIGYDIRTLILPMWAVAASHSWIIVAGLSIYTCMYYSWLYGIGMLVAYFLLPSFMPIPSSVYDGVFKKLAVFCRENLLEGAQIRAMVQVAGYGHRLEKYL